MIENIKKISNYEWQIPKTNDMKVPAKIFASENLLKLIKKDNTLQQLQNVAKLPGIIKNSIVLPDAHQGYGAPIGCVAAFDLEKGVISPGIIGFDINCGVRLATTNIPVKEFIKKQEQIIKDIFNAVPTGVGSENNKISKQELNEILVSGANWAIKNNLGIKEDIEKCEEKACILGADPKFVSQRAIARGLSQLGTLGAGNHFLEFQEINKVFDKKTAEIFKLNKENLTIMIHCGSRGLGHQIASDYTQLFIKENLLNIQEKELASAPFNSDLGQNYFKAMKCAVNFAFCNRQVIMHNIRSVLKKHFPYSELSLVYDVAHNIAKVEEHQLDLNSIKKTKICVHRKGATRSFGPERPELPEVYKKTGQPVLIPGSMGTSSYVLVGTKKAEQISFASTAHGAGRLESRTSAKKRLNPEKIKQELKNKNILLMLGSISGIVEEAPEVYKDVNEVVKISHELGIGNLVVKTKPLAVIKG